MSAPGLSVLRPTTSILRTATAPPRRSALKNSMLVRSSPNVLLPTRSSSQRSSCLTANPDMTIIDIEARLREKVRQHLGELQSAFQTYDVETTLSVTKGEFRRVLEMYCLPLTGDQFEAVMAKVTTNPNGTVRYIEFLEKFYGHPPGVSNYEDIVTKGPRKSSTQDKVEKETNIDMIIAMLRDKMKKNMKNVIKGFHLFDYNRDGHIQRHEMRRLLENYCFKLSDEQYEKIWNRFDMRHTGLLDYEDFLVKLGVKNKKTGSPDCNDSVNSRRTADNRKLAVTPNRISRGSGLNNMNLIEIEREFRSRMRENYADLRRAFLVIDSDSSGFVNLKDLKGILNSFTVPMNEELFLYIMNKNAFKASGKIAWEIFLEKFQDPQSGGNGQTIPIGEQNHKFFPIRGAHESKTVEYIQQLLWDRVQDGFSSFRQAFLQMDKNRNGKVSRKEIRRMMETFKFPITDEQYKEIFILLDPSHSNMINYHQFLDLFEPKESLEGHQWLNSVHKYNDKEKPLCLAWETVEDLLVEKISRNWKDIAEGIIVADKKDEGVIYPLDLKKILDKHCLPTTFEHFESLVERCDTREDGRIDYSEFFSKLGVDLVPNDTAGVSYQIQEGNDLSEKRRKDYLIRSISQFDKNTQDRTSLMTPREIWRRLRDRMSQHCTGIRKAFRSYDKQNKGKVSKRDFRKILDSMGFSLSDEQFAALVEMLEFHNGYLDYRGFVEAFDDPRDTGVDETIVRSGNHHVNSIRGDQWGMTAEDVEERLHRKLLNGFTNLRDAFFKFDDDHTGFLTKCNFRRMLDSFMLILDDREYARLCDKLEITDKTRIGYKEFLNKFEVLDSAEGHHWISDHRTNEAVPEKVLNADQVHDLLVEKAHRQYSDLARAFRRIDVDGNGVITRFELRGLLYKFVISTNKEEFAKLWARYDPHGKGAISHQAFLEKLGAAESFAPDDRFGESNRLLASNYQTVSDHRDRLVNHHDVITLRQAQRGHAMSTEDLYNLLRSRIHDYYKDFYTVFRQYDKKHKGVLSVHEFQKVLNELNIFIRDEQFFDLMDRIGMVTDRSTLNYEEFLRAFEEGRKSAYGKRRPVIRVETNVDLSNLEAESKLRGKVVENADVLFKAFTAIDSDKTDRVKASVFRRVLDNFCFKMSDAQFKQMMTKIRVEGDDTVNYAAFLDLTKKDDDSHGLAWLESVQRSVRAKTPHPMDLEEIQDRLREMVKARVYIFARAFAEIDYAKIGVIAKDDFRRVIHEYAFRLTESQVRGSSTAGVGVKTFYLNFKKRLDRLWATLPINSFGNLDYKDFLIGYCTDFDEEEFEREVGFMDRQSPLLIDRPMTRRPDTPGGTGRRPGTPARCRTSPRPATPASMRPSHAVFGRRPQSARPSSRVLYRTRWEPHHSSPLVNAETLERRLRPVIYKNWRDIQKQCRARDVHNNGFVSELELRDILGRHCDLDDEDIGQLMAKYDIRGEGQFSYIPFLRHFVLTMKPKGLAKRKHRLAGSARIPEPAPLQEAMRRLRECVQDRWKEMRRTFRHLDKQNQGHVTATQFHEVLKQFTPNLSEDEYFFILSNFDRDVSGYVPYNEFLKACIQKNK